MATGKKLLTYSGHSDQVNALAFSQTSKLMASASFDKSVKLWDVSTGKEIASMPWSTGAVEFSPDGKTLAVGTGPDRPFQLFDVQAVLKKYSVN